MNHVIWQETRKVFGLSVNVQLEYNRGTLVLAGEADAFGCKLAYAREVSGNTDWRGVIGKCAGHDVWLCLRIRSWRRTSTYVSFDLSCWTTSAMGSWLPPGGVSGKVHGSLQMFESGDELKQYLLSTYKCDLQEHGLRVSVDPEPISELAHGWS